MVSMKAAARALIVVSMMIATVLAEPGGRIPRGNPLGVLDDQDLADLLDTDLDEVFLMPKTMLQHGGGGGVPLNNHHNNKHHHHRRHHHHNNNVQHHHQNRHLQEDQQEEAPPPSPFLAETAAPTAGGAVDRGISFTPSPSAVPSLSETTGAPTDATDRGLTSSFFSSYSAPSAAPTAAPTMGSGSREGLFESVSPTAAPSSPGRDLDIEEDTDVDVTPPREVASAQKLSNGGNAGVAVGVVTMTILGVVVGALS